MNLWPSGCCKTEAWFFLEVGHWVGRLKTENVCSHWKVAWFSCQVCMFYVCLCWCQAISLWILATISKRLCWRKRSLGTQQVPGCILHLFVLQIVEVSYCTWCRFKSTLLLYWEASLSQSKWPAGWLYSYKWDPKLNMFSSILGGGWWGYIFNNQLSSYVYI